MFRGSGGSSVGVVTRLSTGRFGVVRLPEVKAKLCGCRSAEQLWSQSSAYSVGTGDFFLGIKRSRLEADDLAPSNAVIKNECSYVRINLTRQWSCLLTAL